MKRIKKIVSTMLIFVSLAINIHAQDAKPELDPSKPTNLYTQVNASFEFQNHQNTSIYGVRTNMQYAFDPNNLILVELPLLYNDASSKFGIGDVRVRYFNAFKRNISPSFIAIVPFVDCSFPTGSYTNGLGSSSVSASGGLMLGFVVTKKLSVFPGISYLHVTKPGTDLIPDIAKFAAHGIGLRFNASYKITKKTFIFVNPMPTFMSINSDWTTNWTAELNLNHIIKPSKFKVNAGWSPDFTNKIHIFKCGATVFL